MKLALRIGASTLHGTRDGVARLADPLAADAVSVQYDGEPPLDLWLLRSGRSLEGADLDAFGRHLERAAALDVDLVIVDTPPALGPITTATLRTSALVIIPAMPGKESLERANDVIALARMNPDPPAIRILITLAHLQSNLFRWMQEQLDELYPAARIPAVVPYEMPAGEAALFEVPVTVSSPRSRSAARRVASQRGRPGPTSRTTQQAVRCRSGVGIIGDVIGPTVARPPVTTPGPADSAFRIQVTRR